MMNTNINRRSFLTTASVMAAGAQSIVQGTAYGDIGRTVHDLKKSSVNYMNKSTNEYISRFTIIDAHAHFSQGIWHHIPYESVKDMVGNMDYYSVRTMCVSSVIAMGTDYRLGNDHVIKACEDYPGRFIGYVYVNSHFKDEMADELNRCFKKCRYPIR